MMNIWCEASETECCWLIYTRKLDVLCECQFFHVAFVHVFHHHKWKQKAEEFSHISAIWLHQSRQFVSFPIWICYICPLWGICKVDHNDHSHAQVLENTYRWCKNSELICAWWEVDIGALLITYCTPDGLKDIVDNTSRKHGKKTVVVSPLRFFFTTICDVAPNVKSRCTWSFHWMPNENTHLEVWAPLTFGARVIPNYLGAWCSHSLYLITLL